MGESAASLEGKIEQERVTPMHFFSWTFLSLKNEKKIMPLSRDTNGISTTTTTTYYYYYYYYYYVLYI